MASKKEKKRPWLLGSKNSHGGGGGILRHKQRYGTGCEDDFLISPSNDLTYCKVPVTMGDNCSPPVNTWCGRAADCTYGADEPMDFNVKSLRNNLRKEVQNCSYQQGHSNVKSCGPNMENVMPDDEYLQKGNFCSQTMLDEFVGSCRDLRLTFYQVMTACIIRDDEMVNMVDMIQASDIVPQTKQVVPMVPMFKNNMVCGKRVTMYV